MKNAVAVILILASLAQTCQAATIEDKLNACDAALNAKIREATLCDLGVKLRTDEIERVSKENAELRSRGAGFLDNPFVFAAIGVIFGVWAGARATR